MQVFKSYFKVMRKYIGQMIMYAGIFCGIMVAFMNLGKKTGSDEYIDKQCKFSVIDNDNSDISRVLIAYLADTQKRVSTVEDGKENVQDALYNRDVDCVVEIPAGFETAFLEGRAEGMLDITTIPGTQASTLFEARLDRYMNMLSLYTSMGQSADEADATVRDVLKQNAEVTFADETKAQGNSMAYNFFNYLGWTMICIMIVGVAPVLQVYNKKMLRARIECSAYRFVNLNKELVLGMLVTGMGVCGLFAILSLFLVGTSVLSIKGLLFIANMIVYACVALALAFLISKLTQSEEILSMCANVISLGMAFLCGIFVPREFLGEGVLVAAHFLPAYWYGEAALNIDHYTSGSLSSIGIGILVQLMFALVFILIGMAVDRYKTAGRAMA